MNDMIDTSSDLRDLIAVDYRELYVPYADLDEATKDRLEREADQRIKDQECLTCDDLI